LRFGRKSTILLIVSFFVFVYLTLYTTAAHNVARYVYENDSAVVWRSAPSGSFSPWPSGPGMLLILSRMNETDVFIYTYLIKSWLLLGATILLWIGVAIYILKLIRVRFYESPR